MIKHILMNRVKLHLAQWPSDGCIIQPCIHA